MRLGTEIRDVAPIGAVMVSAALFACFAGGLALIAAAAALMYVPAGVAVAGVELAGCAVLYSRSGRPE